MRKIFRRKDAGSPLLALLTIGIIVLSVLGLSGCVEEAEVGELVECPTFDIEPSAINDVCILNSAKDGFSIPALANTTQHNLSSMANGTWVDPQFSFLIEPIMVQGMDATNLAQIFFEISDPEITIDTSSDEYYLVTKSGGNRQWIFAIDDGDDVRTKYADGSCQMLLTESCYINLTVDINQDSMSRIENTYDKTSVYIIFSNGCGWSERYALDFFITLQFTDSP